MPIAGRIPRHLRDFFLLYPLPGWQVHAQPLAPTLANPPTHPPQKSTRARLFAPVNEGRSTKEEGRSAVHPLRGREDSGWGAAGNRTSGSPTALFQKVLRHFRRCGILPRHPPDGHRRLRCGKGALALVLLGTRDMMHHLGGGASTPCEPCLYSMRLARRARPAKQFQLIGACIWRVEGDSGGPS